MDPEPVDRWTKNRWTETDTQLMHDDTLARLAGPCRLAILIEARNEHYGTHTLHTSKEKLVLCVCGGGGGGGGIAVGKAPVS